MAIDLHKKLLKIRRDILTMAASVEQQVDNALAALVHKDLTLAKEVHASDREINSIELDIESECLRIFALTHPVAGDLRFIMAVLRINSDLERIGDKAKSIAKRVIDLIDCTPVPLPLQLADMAQQTRTMLSNALTALADEDAALCRSVLVSDDRVDELQKDIFRWAHQEIPRNVECTHAVISVLSISRALERIADLATNIAENVIFLVEGSVVRHKKI